MNYTISGPYFENPSPYPDTGCKYNYWYVRNLDRIIDTMIGPIPDTYEIMQFIEQPNRFIIRHTWPTVECESMEEVINRIMSDERIPRIG